ncbi:TetR/AcrR family transcriptional regulator [Robertmurraya andreesenii]|uniref:AcrR family transcriptional regulator n=1 Tax=Anoxybacillus andreesenii TaxID=1325932 RepID=A0ABT9V9F6_9BACL|nr:TetR/AcrR family transcriptional regulator [Robertmurraya andreesenii]MDQ0157586.1 AcrR family transcriptional regulator [Robertmurraya andreesenii]
MVRKAERRRSMISAARKLFAEYGFENTTMQNIADEAKVGVATLFRYFPRKEDLIIEVVKEAIEQQVPRFEEITQSNKTGIEKMEDVLTAYIDFISEEYRETTKLLEAFELYITFVPVEKSMLEEIEKAYGEISSIVAEIVKEGKEDGSIQLSISDEFVWNTIFSMFGTAVKKYTLYTFLPDTILPVPSKEELMMVKKFMISFLKNSTQ